MSNNFFWKFIAFFFEFNIVLEDILDIFISKIIIFLENYYDIIDESIIYNLKYFLFEVEWTFKRCFRIFLLFSSGVYLMLFTFIFFYYVFLFFFQLMFVLLDFIIEDLLILNYFKKGYHPYLNVDAHIKAIKVSLYNWYFGDVNEYTRSQYRPGDKKVYINYDFIDIDKINEPVKNYKSSIFRWDLYVSTFYKKCFILIYDFVMYVMGPLPFILIINPVFELFSFLYYEFFSLEAIEYRITFWYDFIKAVIKVFRIFFRYDNLVRVFSRAYYNFFVSFDYYKKYYMDYYKVNYRIKIYYFYAFKFLRKRKNWRLFMKYLDLSRFVIFYDYLMPSFELNHMRLLSKFNYFKLELHYSVILFRVMAIWRNNSFLHIWLVVSPFFFYLFIFFYYYCPFFF